MLGSKVSNAVQKNNFAFFFFYACKIKKGGWEGSGKVGTRQAGCAAQDSVLS